MLSKLRYLTQPHAARGTLCRSRAFLDRATSKIQDIQQRTQTDKFSDRLYCEDEVIYSEINGASSKCQDDDKKTDRTSFDSFSREIVTSSKKNNVRKAGAGRLFQAPPLMECKGIDNFKQNQFLSTSSNSFQNEIKSQTDKSMGWLAGIKHLMYGEEKSAIEKDPEELPKGSLWPLMKGCDTAEEVLELMEPKIERQELDIEQYDEILQKLQMIIYKDLNQRYGWLAEEIIPSMYVSLILNDTRVAEFESLGKVPAFQKLQENLMQLHKKMTVGQFVSCLSAFVWLGVPATSPAIVTLMSELENFSSEDFTVLSLHILSVCLLSFGRPDVLIVLHIYPKLKGLIEDGRKIANDKKTLFSLIFLGHLKIRDSSLGVWLTQQILKIDEETDHLKDPFLAAMCMKFCRDMKMVAAALDSEHFSYFSSHSKSINTDSKDLVTNIQTLIDRVIISLMDVHDCLSCLDIGRAAYGAQFFNIYDMPWADLLKKRSLELIFDEDLPVGQKVHALTGLGRCDSMDTETLKKIDEFILNNINVVDALSASHILYFLSYQEKRNKYVLAACEKKIVEDFEKMVGFRTLSRRLFTFLAECPMQDTNIHVHLQRKLLELETYNYDHDLILYYLINQKYWLKTSPAVLNKVSGDLGLCKLNDYNKILRVASYDSCWLHFRKRMFNLKTNNLMAIKTNQAILRFETNIAKRYFSIVEGNDSFNFVLNYSSKIQAVNPIIGCSRAVIRAFEKSSEIAAIDETRFKDFLHIIEVQQGTVSPKLFEKVFDAFATKIAGEVSDKSTSICDVMLKKTAQWFCVESDKVTAPLKEKIQDAFATKLDILLKDRDAAKTVTNMCRLCCLGILPEIALLELLNVDALSKLDEKLEEQGNEYSRRILYDMIAMINRCVVMDRPDIQIPWFMGSHAEERLEYRNSNMLVIYALEKFRKLLSETITEKYFGYQEKFEYGYYGGKNFTVVHSTQEPS